MATSKKTGLRYADLPAVDVARFADNPAATRAMEQVRQIMAIRFGNSGQDLDRAVTWGDLVENGIVATRRPNGKLLRATADSGTFQPATPVEPDGIPPAPTGVRATPGLATVILEWDQPAFSYFGYAEIWRSATNNLAEAVMVGQTTAWIYPDAISNSATLYYWIRFISKKGKEGAFNAVGGTVAATSLDPTYLIDVLSANDPNALLYKVPEPTEINGVLAPAGLYMRDIFVANGSITNLMLGNLVVDDAKVKEISAAKVTFGEMEGDRIEVNSLNADRITVDSLVARLAILTEAYIENAHIIEETVESSKIKSLDARKVNFGEMSGDRIAVNTLNGDRIIANTLAAKLAQITTAYIKRANIGVAEVDTLHLGGNAVSVHATHNAPASEFHSGYSGQIDVNVLVANRPTRITTTYFHASQAGWLTILMEPRITEGAVQNVVAPYNFVYLDGQQIMRPEDSIRNRYVGPGTHSVQVRQWAGISSRGNVFQPSSLQWYYYYDEEHAVILFMMR